LLDSELEYVLIQKFAYYYANVQHNNAPTNFFYSIESISDRITDDQQVIDIGCGINPFKGLIQNLIGIDLVDVGADIVTSVESFQPTKKFDVAICFGSLQFGSYDYVLKQLMLIDKFMNEKSMIIWKFTPNDYVMHDDLDRFPLSEDILNDLAKKFNYIQSHFMHNINRQQDLRGYTTWTRKN